MENITIIKGGLPLLLLFINQYKLRISTLGVLSKVLSTPTNKDLNNIEASGTTSITGSDWTNGPSSQFYGVVLSIYYHTSIVTWSAQFAYYCDQADNNKYKFAARNYRIDGTGWSAWKAVALT